MHLLDLDHFVCRPHPSKKNTFCIAELKVAHAVCVPGFICIPYKNPKNGKVFSEYYQVVNEFEYHCPPSTESTQSHVFKASTNKTKYIEKVHQIQKQIQLGNIYEINYCLEFFEENASLSVLDVFQKLIDITKAPYTYLLKLGDDFIICCSPELFLKRSGNTLYSKPIKGTIKRGQNKHEDEKLKLSLQNSLKERTENVMAVDVARNDLSKIAKKGSVSVNKLFNIESFETVHQMVSTVKCDLPEQVNIDEIIAATFPMASMTGAPKTSAMNLSDIFEDFERNYYSGSFGFIDAEGNFEWPVVIRSIFYNQKSRRLSIAAGGAITYLSEAEQEYEEIILKLQAQLKALNGNIQY